jgi:hypothetical protein
MISHDIENIKNYATKIYDVNEGGITCLNN